MTENKSTVSSYRINQETKDKIKQQMEQLGLRQQVYFDRVVTLMELENVKENNLFSVDTVELQKLTQRINNIFINVCEQGNSFLSSKDVELKELKQKYKNMLADKESCITLQKEELQSVYTKINVLQNDNDKHQQELESIKLDSKKQLEQLVQSVSDKENLIIEYKGKIDTLSSVATEYKAYADENKQLQQQVNELNKTIDTLNLNEKEMVKSFEKSKEVIQNLTEESNEIMKKLKKSHAEQMQQQKDKLEIQKDKEILELKQLHQEQIQKQQEEYNDKVKNLLLQLEVKTSSSKKKTVKSSTK